MSDDQTNPDVVLTTEGGVHEFTQLAELSAALSVRLSTWSTDGADPASAGSWPGGWSTARRN